MHRFKENIKYDIGRIQVVATHGAATLATGQGVDMQKYNNFCGLVGCGIGLGTNNVSPITMYIAESTDNITFSANYIATATAATATGTATGYGNSVECRAEQMSDGYRYLRVEVLSGVTGTANLIAIGNLRFNSRYPQATLPTP